MLGVDGTGATAAVKEIITNCASNVNAKIAISRNVQERKHVKNLFGRATVTVMTVREFICCGLPRAVVLQVILHNNFDRAFPTNSQ